MKPHAALRAEEPEPPPFRTSGSQPTLPTRLRFALRRTSHVRTEQSEARARAFRAMLLASVVCGAVLAGAAGLLTLAHSKSVTVAVSGEAYPARTQSSTVGDLLKEFNIVVGEADHVSPSLDSPIVAEMVVRVERARAVTLIVDGQTQVLWTALTHPVDILTNAQVSLASNDRIVLDGTHTRFVDLPRWPVPVTQILVRHALSLPIEDDGQQTVIETTAETVGEALFDAGITLYLADTVTPELNTPIRLMNDAPVRIERATPILIEADGVRTRTRAPGETVADALADAGIALVGMDYSIPDETTILQGGMTIRVVRVREVMVVREVETAFATVYQPDSSLPVNERYTAQVGEMGLERVQVRIRYEDGIAVSERRETTTVVRPPQDRIIHFGTQNNRTGAALNDVLNTALMTEISIP